MTEKTAPTVAARPSMGSRDLLTLYLTSLIGSGILVIPGITAQLAGPISLLAWGLLAVGSFAMAHLFAKLATLNPNTGGLCTLIGRALGERFGDTALLVLVSVYVIGNPIMGVISARYLGHLFGLGSGWLMPSAVGFMLLSVGFTLLGVKAGARVQRTTFAVLLLCLVAAIAVAVPSMSVERLTPVAPEGWGALGGAAVIAFFAFLGWENVLMVAKDVHEPHRAFPRAIAIAVPVVGLVYLITTAAYLSVPASDGTIVLPALLGNGLGTASVVVADVLALAVLVVATNAWVFGASRVITSAARRGLLPRVLADTHPVTGVPVKALFVLAVGYSAVVAGMALFELDEHPMLLFTSAVFLTLYVAVGIAALRGHPPRSLKVSAGVTIALALLFLPSTALALPAALLLVLLMWLATLRKPVATRAG